MEEDNRMNDKRKAPKNPATPEKIYKIMITITFLVAALFLSKNLYDGRMQEAIVVGGCLLVFGIGSFLMKKLNTSMVSRQLFLCISLLFLVFIISMNSGDFYSDDFLLFLAIIALSGMYLQPSYPLFQAITATILLIILYVLHPEKADPLPQFAMCVMIFDIAAFTMYLLIKRGRSFIELSTYRAEQAEQLLTSIQRVGEELEANYQQSSGRIQGMQEVNQSLDGNVIELKRGSQEITQGTQEVDITCRNALEEMQATEQNVENLNKEIKKVEVVLEENKVNMHTMAEQMQHVKRAVGEVNAVFALLQEQISEISGVTEQLTSISSSTKMLALNASIEAARAGQSGAGFAVVASKVQDLAVDSNNCSNHVVEIVDKMKAQIEKTTKELTESTEVIEVSLITLNGLEKGFDGLTTQFDSLYNNIEEQNHNIQKVDTTFGQLRDRVLEMGAYAEENQASVENIVTVTKAYREYVSRIVEDTKQIHELSASMLENTEEI